MTEAINVTSDQVIACASLALVIGGALLAWLSGNLFKRLAGIIVAASGALVTASALAAPESLITSGAAVIFVELVIGGAVAVRLYEAYGSIEAAEVDSLDGREDLARPQDG
ncbi:MAG: hypothetical protein R3C25_09625 [Hyphomonadaceae bacterium]